MRYKNFLISVVLSGSIIVVSLLLARKIFAPAQSNQKAICYVAGRSGGHIVPTLTLLKKYAAPASVFISTDTQLDHKLLDNNSSITEHISLSLGNVPRSFLQWPRYAWDLCAAKIKIMRTLYRYKPSLIVTTGGYVAVPVSVIAWVLGIPVHVYELDAVPGKSKLFLSRIAAKTFVCFDAAKKLFPKNAALETVGYPIRFTQGDHIDSVTACQTLGIDPAKKVIVVLGGSQGSQFLNEKMPDYVGSMAEKNLFFVLHQTGAQEVEKVRERYHNKEIAAQVFSYRNDINIIYSAADFVVCRAGAGTLFELLFFNVPALIIPLETETTDHQIDNARAMVQQYPRQFSWMRQKDVEAQPHELTSRIASIL